MESVDMKKLETAIIYLQRITEGNNPINNLPAEENSILNNPNVIRCMFFIKDILEKVKRNNGYIGRKSYDDYAGIYAFTEGTADYTGTSHGCLFWDV